MFAPACGRRLVSRTICAGDGGAYSGGAGGDNGCGGGRHRWVPRPWTAQMALGKLDQRLVLFIEIDLRTEREALWKADSAACKRVGPRLHAEQEALWEASRRHALWEACTMGGTMGGRWQARAHALERGLRARLRPRARALTIFEGHDGHWPRYLSGLNVNSTDASRDVDAANGWNRSPSVSATPGSSTMAAGGQPSSAPRARPDHRSRRPGCCSRLAWCASWPA